MEISKLSGLLAKINTEIKLKKDQIKMYRDVQIYLIKLDELDRGQLQRKANGNYDKKT